jgi:hypothetical protein
MIWVHVKNEWRVDFKEGFEPVTERKSPRGRWRSRWEQWVRKDVSQREKCFFSSCHIAYHQNFL